MTNTQKITLVAVVAYMIDNHDVPSQIRGEGLTWRISGNNEDLDESRFSIAVSELGTVYISTSGNSYTAKFGTDEITVTGTTNNVSSAQSYGLDQGYDFDVSTSHISFQMDGYHEFDVSR
jgi:hypothetical protein